jgi:hypothetical protein
MFVEVLWYHFCKDRGNEARAVCGCQMVQLHLCPEEDLEEVKPVPKLPSQKLS